MRPLNDKKGEPVAKALKDIPRAPNKIRTNKGKEFKARQVEALLRQREIQHLFDKTHKLKPTMWKRSSWQSGRK